MSSAQGLPSKKLTWMKKMEAHLKKQQQHKVNSKKEENDKSSK